MMAPWWTEIARAADCAPLDDAGVRALVAEAKDAVDRDDLIAFAETRRRLFQELPCAADPLPVDAWARFLLDEAVVAYALGEPWESALGTALSLAPELPRGDLPEALRDWHPGPVPAASGPLASGEYWVDGRGIAAVPELSGLH